MYWCKMVFASCAIFASLFHLPGHSAVTGTDGGNTGNWNTWPVTEKVVAADMLPESYCFLTLIITDVTL